MDVDGRGKEFLGRGWGFTFTILPDSGGVREVAYDIDVQESIRIILGTAKRERVMRPDFGCGIHDLVFSVVDTAAIAQIKRDVIDALREFEARIDVLRVT